MKRKLNSVGLTILALLLALHLASLIDLGAMIWVVAAFIFVAAFGIVTTPRDEEVGPQ